LDINQCINNSATSDTALARLGNTTETSSSRLSSIVAFDSLPILYLADVVIPMCFHDPQLQYIRIQKTTNIHRGGPASSCDESPSGADFILVSLLD
jgi:hypothetical protein